MRILVIGSDGKIGSELVKYYESQNHTVFKTTRNAEKINEKNYLLDLSENSSNWPSGWPKIDVVFFCASITSVQYCENEPEISYKINVLSTQKLLKIFSDLGFFIIYISSNMVFDGLKPFANVDDKPNPRTEYGKQKAEIENYLLNLIDNSAIVRLGKVVTFDMSLINNWILKLKKGNTISAFTDMFISPISIEFTLNLLSKIAQTKMQGIFQATSNQDISYYQLAKHITNKLELSDMLVERASYKNSGIRFSPKNTTLNTSRLKNIGISSPDSFDAFEHFFNT